MTRSEFAFAHDEILDAIEDALRPEAMAVGGDADQALTEWVIDGTRSAEWALRKRARARAQLAELTHLVEEEIAVLNHKLEQLSRGPRATIDYFDGKLEQYHRQILKTEPKRLTVELPGGKLTSTAGAVSIVVDDHHALVEWIETLGAPDEFLEYEEKPKKTELKKRYGAKIGDEAGDYPLADEATGVVLPGVRAVRGDRTFHVKP
jgi:hypothetical protein